MKLEEQFNSIKPIVKEYAERFSKATDIPKEEYESALYEEFALKVNRYDGRIAFSAFIKPILNQRALRVAARKERRFYENVTFIEDLVDDEGNPTYSFEDDSKTDDIAINKIEKSPDKLQLIRALTEKADDFTVAAVSLLLSKPNASLTSIATEMGVNHTTLKRKVQRLARNYDQSRFGDLQQYLAV